MTTIKGQWTTAETIKVGDRIRRGGRDVAITGITDERTRDGDRRFTWRDAQGKRGAFSRWATDQMWKV